MNKHFVVMNKYFILAAVFFAWGAVMGVIFQKDRTETQMSESRDSAQRVNYCTQICLVQEQAMLGVVKDPEWRCFCADGYWQPLP